ncbi:MAG: hypothetical protein A2X49_00210 [Lentisphaerae bacterium GWF2_52_8]|nr:MAG: hypothetical protein A2X49_00210 [Lentisphaerae bacterium GWF2_52_8]
MSFEFTLARVALEDIDFTDRTFSISFPETSPALEACMARTGVCTPPLLAPSGKMFTPVAGRRRLVALRKTGAGEVAALIACGTPGKKALLSYSILDNCSKRRLNPVEAAASSAKLIAAGFTESEVLEIFFPSFGLEKSLKILGQLFSVNRLSKAAKTYILDKKILPSAVKKVFDGAGKHAPLYMAFAEKAGLGTNDFARIFELMDDIALKSGGNLREIIGQAEGLEPKSLYGHLADSLNPGLASLRREIAGAERRFSKRRILEIKIPEHYEGDGIILTSALKSKRDLDELASLLENLRGEKDFGKIFDEL